MAANVGVKVRGTQQIIAAINRMSADMTGPAMRKGMRTGAEWVRELARANLIDHIDTGLLWDSLRVNMRINNAKRNVSGSMTTTRATDYGTFLEYGTVKMMGVHWMQRAAESGGDRVIDHVRESLAESLARVQRVN